MTNTEKFCKEVNTMANLYEQKNKAYGDSFSISVKKYGPIAGLTRLSDKFNRLETLILNKDIACNGEALSDTLVDLANYAIMLKMEIDGKDDEDDPAIFPTHTPSPIVDVEYAIAYAEYTLKIDRITQEVNDGRVWLYRLYGTPIEELKEHVELVKQRIAEETEQEATN